MAAKTRPTEANVDDFLDGVTPAKRRADGHELAQICAEVTGVNPVMWGPSIVGFGETELFSNATGKSVGTWPIVAFSPRKSALTLYGMTETEEMRALLPSLGTYTESVACVYVKKLDDIDREVLRRLIRACWEAHTE